MFKKIERYNMNLELESIKTEYEQKQRSFLQKFEELTDRISRLNLKKEEQKNIFWTLVPFIQLSQRKVINTKQKSIVDRWVIEKLSKDIEHKKKETIYLQNKLVRIKVSLEKHYVFKVFMDKIVRESPATHTRDELINRYGGLLLCNDRLNTIHEEATDNLSELRNKRAAIYGDVQHLNLYNQLTNLKNKYSTQNRMLKKLQAYFDALIHHGTQRILALANIRVVTNELYRMLEPDVSTQDTFAQLTKIAIHGEKMQTIKNVLELSMNNKNTRRNSEKKVNVTNIFLEKKTNKRNIKNSK